MKSADVHVFFGHDEIVSAYRGVFVVDRDSSGQIVMVVEGLKMSRIMVPAHLHDAPGDLFTIVEKFWDCPKFWQCSCYIVICSLNSCYIRVLFGVFRSLLLYFVLGS